MALLASEQQQGYVVVQWSELIQCKPREHAFNIDRCLGHLGQLAAPIAVALASSQLENAVRQDHQPGVGRELNLTLGEGGHPREVEGTARALELDDLVAVAQERKRK